MKKLRIGDKVKSVRLEHQNEQAFRISDFEDKRILLYSHPLAWTQCAKQMNSLEKNKSIFNSLNTTISRRLQVASRSKAEQRFYPSRQTSND
jgi:peroxiredoxin